MVLWGVGYGGYVVVGGGVVGEIGGIGMNAYGMWGGSVGSVD